MQRFRRSVRGTLYTAVLWAGTACCGYALTSNQDPARDCLAGTPALACISHKHPKTFSEKWRNLHRMESQGPQVCSQLLREAVYSETEITEFLSELIIITSVVKLFSQVGVCMVQEILVDRISLQHG